MAPQPLHIHQGDGRPVEISNLYKFNQTIKTMTYTCSAHDFQVGFGKQAAQTIAGALNCDGASNAAAASGTSSSSKMCAGPASVNIETVAVRLRCHTAGIGGFSSYCVARSDIALRVVIAPSLAETVTLRALGQAEIKEGGQTCGAGQTAARDSMIVALRELSSDLRKQIQQAP